MITRILIPFCLCCLIASGPLLADEPAVSLGDYLVTMLDRHPALGRIRAEHRAQLFTAGRIAAIGDLVFSAGASLAGRDPLDNYGMAIGSGYSQASVEASLAKKFPELGGLSARLSAGYLQYSYDSAMGAGRQESREPSLSLALSLPLLANALGYADRKSLETLAATRALLAAAESEAIETLVLEAAAAWFDWRLAAERAGAYAEQRERAATLAAQTERKRAAGLADWSDVHLARQNQQRYQTLAISAVEEAQRRLLAVLAFHSGSATNQAVPAFQTQFPTNLEAVEPELDPAAPCRTLRLAALQETIAACEAAAAGSRALPALDLSLAAGKSGSGTGFGPLDRSQYQAGIEFRLPLPNRDAGGEAKAREASLDAARRRNRETVLAVANARRSFASSIPRLREALQIGRLSLRTANLRLAAILEKYGQGRAELFHVIDARDALTVARIGLLEAEAALARLVLEELALSDRLLPFFGIGDRTETAR